MFCCHFLCHRPLRCNGWYLGKYRARISTCRSVIPSAQFDWLWWGENMSQNCDHERACCSSPGDIWAWRAMVLMMPARDTAWPVHQSFLAVLPAETSGTSRSENFACQYVKYLKGFLTCRKVLRHGTSGFTSHPKEGVLRIFIALKNPSPRPGLTPQPLGSVASTKCAI
jgi:hypothetical protein